MELGIPLSSDDEPLALGDDVGRRNSFECDSEEPAADGRRRATMLAARAAVAGTGRWQEPTDDAERMHGTASRRRGGSALDADDDGMVGVSAGRSDVGPRRRLATRSHHSRAGNAAAAAARHDDDDEGDDGGDGDDDGDGGLTRWAGRGGRYAAHADDEDGNAADADDGEDVDAADVAADTADFEAAVFGAAGEPPPFSFASAGYNPVSCRCADLCY